MHALVRRPASTLATSCELTHLDRVPIDFARIEAQHAAYGATLRAAGLEVLELPALPDHPDSVFVEDAAVVLDGLAILARPGTASRIDEPARLRPPLESLGLRIAALTAPATLDGGDVQGIAVIGVDPAEPFAANVLRLPGRLVVNAAFPATRRIVEAHARTRIIEVLAVDIGEFGKAEAGLTCLCVLAG